MINKPGYWAVRIDSDDPGIKPQYRITTDRVRTPLEAVDNALGTRFSALNPMRIDVLHDFSHIRVKMISTTITPLRSDKYRLAALFDPLGWVMPSYPPELVARVRRDLARIRGEQKG